MEAVHTNHDTRNHKAKRLRNKYATLIIEYTKEFFNRSNGMGRAEIKDLFGKYQQKWKDVAYKANNDKTNPVALDMKGFEHYVKKTGYKRIYLYSPTLEQRTEMRRIMSAIRKPNLFEWLKIKMKG